MGTFPAPIAVDTSWCVCTTEFTSDLARMMAACSAVSRGGTGSVIVRPRWSDGFHCESPPSR